MPLFRNGWYRPQAWLLQSPHHLGQGVFSSIFAVELLAHCPKLPFATSSPASALIFYWTVLMVCFRMSSTSPCCDGASVAFFSSLWQVRLVAISVELSFALEVLSLSGLRSFLLGFLLGRDQQRVEASRALLQRVVQILLAVFSTGGHVCLEQPSSALSWQDPSAQDLLAQTAAVCSAVPACSFGLKIHKKWLFASSLQDMSQLAGTCAHASWEHENLVGKRDEWGGVCTQQSAVYPDGLCEAIVQIIRPLFPLCEPPFDVSVATLTIISVCPHAPVFVQILL